MKLSNIKQWFWRAVKRSCVDVADLIWNTPRRHFRHAVRLEQQGRYKRAISFYRKAISMDDRNAKWHFRLGQLLERRGKLAAAIRAYGVAIQRSPQSAYLYFHLGMAEAKKGKLRAASKSFAKALALDDREADWHYQYGQVLEQSRRYLAAAGVYRTALDKWPDDIKLQLRLANALASAQKWKQAVKVYRSALSADPIYPELSYQLGVAYEKIGKLSEAAASIGAATQLSPNNANWRLHLGEIYEKLGHLSDAFKQYEAAASIGTPQAFVGLGRVFSRVGLWGRAAEKYEQAIEGGDSSLQTRLFWATALQRIGDSDKAAEVIESIISDSIARVEDALYIPTAADYIVLIEALLMSGQAERAVDIYSKAKEKFSFEESFHLHCASLFANQGRWNDVVQMLESYIGNTPSASKEIHSLLAKSLHLLGSYKKSEAVCREALGEVNSQIDVSQKHLFSEEEYLNRWGRYDQPLVTIICLAFNHERYIEDAIRGFLIQDTQYPFEIILHDDASTDKTAEIMRKWAEKYPRIIRLVTQTENQYSKGNFPFAITLKLAQGKYIALCEGDDYWIEPSKLQRQTEFLERNSDFSCCGHNLFLYDEIKLRVTQKYKSLDDIELSGEQMMKSGFLIRVATLMFRRSFESLPQEYMLMPYGDVFLSSLLGQYGKAKIFLSFTGSVFRRNSFSTHSHLDKYKKNARRLLVRYWAAKYYRRIGRPDIEMHFINRAHRQLAR